MLSQVHANRIMHPYLTMVGDSSPHNLITGACARCAAPCAAHSRWDRAAVAGTAFAPAVRGNSSLWQSESSRSFQPKDYLSTIQSSSGGMRSEQARRALHRALHRALRGALRSLPTPCPPHLPDSSTSPVSSTSPC